MERPGPIQGNTEMAHLFGQLMFIVFCLAGVVFLRKSIATGIEWNSYRYCAIVCLLTAGAFHFLV